MSTVLELAPLEKMREYVERGLLKSQRHPHRPLTIWNYTPECQYSRAWDEITLQCRGLITNDEGRVIARPFPKFFNLGEYDGPIPDEPFEITEKLDGSLIILAQYKQEVLIASRGSFVSPQAAWATGILADYGRLRLTEGFTYLFELIHPQNRIVIDYGTRKELVLLTIIHTESGREQGNIASAFPMVKTFDFPHGFRDLPQQPNEEGYVIHFESGLRLKVKNEEYVRLHKLLTQTAAKTVWEAMRDGKMNDLLDRVPDEFYQWVSETRLGIESKAAAFMEEARDAFASLDREQSRKDIAISIQREPRHLQPLLFLMLDERPVAPLLWKMVKPQAGDYPFKSISEDEA